MPLSLLACAAEMERKKKGRYLPAGNWLCESWPPYLANFA